MKTGTNAWLLALSAAATLAIGACTNELGAPSTGTLIAARLRASSTTGTSTRASVTPDNEDLSKGETFHWDEQDKLALIIGKTNGTIVGSGWNEFDIDPDFDPETAQDTHADFTGNIPAASANDVVYAMSPWRDNYGTRLTRVPLIVEATQTQTNIKEYDFDNIYEENTSTHIGQFAYMYARSTLPTDLTSGTGGSAQLPQLTFKHLCPLLRFRVRNASTRNWEVAQIELKHSSATQSKYWFATKALVDLTQQDPTRHITLAEDGSSQTMTLEISNCMELAANSTEYEAGKYLNAYLPLLPTTKYNDIDLPEDEDPGPYLTLSITLSGYTTPPSVISQRLYYKQVPFLANGLQPGLRYYFNIVIDKLLHINIDGMGVYDTDIDFEDAAPGEEIVVKE